MSSTFEAFEHPSTVPGGVPPFDRIDENAFGSAIEEGIARHRAEVEAIASLTAAPTFVNTMQALELSGSFLQRVLSVFYNFTVCHTTDAVQKTRAEWAPRLAQHTSWLRTHRGIYERLRAILASEQAAQLSAEQRRLIERTMLHSERQGVALEGEQAQRMEAIQAELSEWITVFGERSLAATNAAAVHVSDESELAGLSAERRGAAADAARDAGCENGWLFPQVSTTVNPLLAQLEHRGLRQRMYEASAARGFGGQHDTREAVLNIVRLRAEQASLLGYEHYSAYAAADHTAGTTAAVEELLGNIVPTVARNVEAERATLTTLLQADGHEGPLEAWDWPFYAARYQEQHHNLNPAEVSAYFELDTVLTEGVFHVAQQLYGLTFTLREDIPSYHPDVRVYEVTSGDEPVGMFMADFYARDTKKGGAWMNFYTQPSGLHHTAPVTSICLNLVRPAEGEPTLLSASEVVTLFHEFGHNLHGLLAAHVYPSQGMMDLPVDFVEFPSQLNEMWAFHPEVLPRYALHHRTGEAMPTELVQRVIDAQQCGEGFRTAEYLAASLLDQDWHQLRHGEEFPGIDEVERFEHEALERRGLALPGIAPRYRTTYFGHLFGSGYGAGYYAYIWSEVLARDVEDWVLGHHGLSSTTGDELCTVVLERGSSRDPLEMYRALMGRDPVAEPLLRKRGLLTPV